MSNEKYQKIELYTRQAKKLIEYCGGTNQLAEKIEFKFNTMIIRDMNHMLTDPGPMSRQTEPEDKLPAIGSKHRNSTTQLRAGKTAQSNETSEGVIGDIEVKELDEEAIHKEGKLKEANQKESEQKDAVHGRKGDLDMK
jgi:hypothetical protein